MLRPAVDARRARRAGQLRGLRLRAAAGAGHAGHVRRRHPGRGGTARAAPAGDPGLRRQGACRPAPCATGTSSCSCAPCATACSACSTGTDINPAVMKMAHEPRHPPAERAVRCARRRYRDRRRPPPAGSAARRRGAHARRPARPRGANPGDPLFGPAPERRRGQDRRAACTEEGRWAGTDRRASIRHYLSGHVDIGCPVLAGRRDGPRRRPDRRQGRRSTRRRSSTTSRSGEPRPCPRATSRSGSSPPRPPGGRSPGRRYFDPVEWQSDLARIERLYQARGYYQAQVVKSDVQACVRPTGAGRTRRSTCWSRSRRTSRCGWASCGSRASTPLTARPSARPCSTTCRCARRTSSARPPGTRPRPR